MNASSRPPLHDTPYRAIVENLPLLVIELDRDFSVRYINQKAQELTGFQADELLDRNWRSTLLRSMPAAEAQDWENKLFDLDVPDQELQGSVINLTMKSGGRLHLSAYIVRLPAGRGERSAHVILCAVDLAEQQTLLEELASTLEEVSVSEEEIRAQNDELVDAQERSLRDRQRYLDLFQYAPDGYLVTDRNGVIQEANQAAADLLHIPANNLVGKPLVIYQPQPERTTFYGMVSKILDQAQGNNRLNERPASVSWETLLELRTGEQVPVSLLAAARQAPHSDVWTIRWHIQNITQRKQAEQAQRQNEQRFRTLFEQAPMGVLLANLDGRITQANLRLQEMLGLQAAELDGRPVCDLIEPADRELFDESLQRLLAAQTSSLLLEVHLGGARGEPLWGRVSFGLARDADQKPQFVVGMIENITSEKQARADLEEVQRRLIQSIEAERLSLARELHDRPMQNLYALSYTLKAWQLELEQPEQIAQVQEIQAQLTAVIQELRRTAQDLRPPTLADFGLEKAIRAHACTFRETYPEIKLDLRLFADGQKLPEPVRLGLYRIYEQALSNIVRHAQATWLQVTLQHTGQEVQLEVQDNGCGFILPQRLVSLARDGHLGLVGMAERAETLGGHLEVHSAPGEGTRVHVRIPYTAPAESTPPASSGNHRPKTAPPDPSPQSS